MAVVENGVNVHSSGGDQGQSNHSSRMVDSNGSATTVSNSNNNHYVKLQHPFQPQAHVSKSNNDHHLHRDHHHQGSKTNGGDSKMNGGNDEEGAKREMRELEEMFSKLNPMAEEFVPPSLAHNISNNKISAAYFAANNAAAIVPMHINPKNGIINGIPGRRVSKDIERKSYDQGRRRTNSRTSVAQREEVIRRTVYVSDIDHQITEEQLAALFLSCGQVVDCRICGDPNSVLRFAFVEFTDEEGAHAALSLSGTMLGYYPVRVLPSKTAIVPVNPTFLPRTEDEREMCARTIYCTNIDKKVTQADVKLFFESVCGEVYRLRLLGDYHHSTRIAFVEFVMLSPIASIDLFFDVSGQVTITGGGAWMLKGEYMKHEKAESAIAALNCSGVVLGTLPIRVSPSKTPVRPRAPRPMMQ